MTIQNDRRINPDGIELSDEQIGEIAGLLAGDLDERKALWQRRLALEGQALEAAINAGAFVCFGPNTPHHNPELTPQEQKAQFQREMTETWGPMGIGWTCMLTGVRDEQCVVYVTPRTAPELFEAITECFAQDRAGLEAARQYVARVPR